jgi:hypothetical protein
MARGSAMNEEKLEPVDFIELLAEEIETWVLSTRFLEHPRIAKRQLLIRAGKIKQLCHEIKGTSIDLDKIMVDMGRKDDK